MIAFDERTRDRFWSKVEPEEVDGCWQWAAGKSSNGYGRFSVYRDEELLSEYAHRVVYEMMVGEIPAGLVIDHLCRNRSCVNPYHLEPIPRGLNVLRGEASSAKAARRGACVRGHEYTEENTYIFRGARQCKTCSNELRNERRRLYGRNGRVRDYA